MPTILRDGTIYKNRFGKPEFRRQQSEIDLETLRKVSNLTGAKSYHAKETKALAKIYEEIDNLEKTEKTVNVKYNYKDIFSWPLLLGLGFLILEQTLTQTSFRRLP